MNAGRLRPAAEGDGTSLRVRSFIARYAGLGALCGLVLPLAATAIVWWAHRGPLAWQAVMHAHRTEPALWLLDIAPLLVGVLGALAGWRVGLWWRAYAHLRHMALPRDARGAARIRDLALAAEIGQRLAAVRDLDALLADAVMLLQVRFDLYYTQVFLTDPAGRYLVLRAGTGLAGLERVRQGQRLPIGPGSLSGTAASQARAIILPDVSESALYQPDATLPRTRSELTVPLLVSGQVVGVLDLQSARVNALTADHLPAFEALAGQLAIAIQNANLFAEVAQARSEIAAQARRLTRAGWDGFLNGVDRAQYLGYIFDLTNVAPLAEPWPAPASGAALTVPITVMGEAIGVLRLEDEPGRVWTPDEEQLAAMVAGQVAQQLESLRLLSEAGRAQARAEEAARRLTREGWEASLEALPVTRASYTYDGRQVTSQAAAADGLAAPTLTQPLTVRGEVVGELSIGGLEALTGQAAELVVSVANQLSSHVENLRLLEETERRRQQLDKRARELEAVAKVSTAASTILEAPELLRNVASLIRANFGLDHVHIYRPDASGQVLDLAAGAEGVGRSIALDDGQSLVARAARSRRGVIVNDLQEAAATEPPAASATQSQMAIPMIAGDEVVGVIDLQSDRGGCFTDEDVRIQTTLAAQVAVALQNANLYSDQAATVARLREVDQLKSTFLANMSHEFRTPLNSILGFADVILEGLDGPLTRRMENDLQIIRKNGQHLLDLISDVLDMAKIEAGRMQLHPEYFDVRDVLAETVEITSSLARAKSLDLRLEVAPSARLDVVADRMRLRQVLINLVGNAIKFTESGGVTLEAERENGQLHVRVRDTGIGIPPDKADLIFEAFGQVDSTTTRRAGGTGLGLPISRHLIELHGGRLWVDSAGLPGQGSTFHVELPVEMDLVLPEAD